MITPSKEFLEVFKKTPGALSVCESIAIMNIASEAPNDYMSGIYLEVGSYYGKSGMSAMVGFKTGRFMLVDPIFENESLAMEVLGRVFHTNEKIGVGTDKGYSTDVIPTFNNLSYVFIDSGSHGDGLPMQEVRILEDRIVPNGIIAFHDYQSQFVEVEQAYNYLLSTGKYEPIPIDWNSIIEYVRENNLEQGNNTWHHTEMEFPCFVGAVRRKS